MKLICLSVALLWLFPLEMLRADEARTQRPNVLFIAVDDLRPELGSNQRVQRDARRIDGNSMRRQKTVASKRSKRSIVSRSEWFVRCFTQAELCDSICLIAIS